MNLYTWQLPVFLKKTSTAALLWLGKGRTNNWNYIHMTLVYERSWEGLKFCQHSKLWKELWNKTYQFPDSVQDDVNMFFADCVMTTGIVVCSIFFAGYQLFWVEKLTVGTCADLICKNQMKNGLLYSWKIHAI